MFKPTDSSNDSTSLTTTTSNNPSNGSPDEEDFSNKLKEFLLVIGVATALFFVVILICCRAKKSKKKRKASVYVRDVDEEILEGEKAKMTRLISSKGEETGVLVTSNSALSSPPRSSSVNKNLGISINNSFKDGEDEHEEKE